MLFPSYSTILLFPLLSSPYGSNKVGWSFCTWIRCTRDSWYSNGPFNSDLVETFKTNAFNASFNAFVLDRVIGPFRTCNGSLLVFLGWSISSFYLARILFLQGCGSLFSEFPTPTRIFNELQYNLQVWQWFINVSKYFSYKDSLSILATQGKKGWWYLMTNQLFLLFSFMFWLN
jgi:hypothetical protein